MMGRDIRHAIETATDYLRQTRTTHDQRTTR
jgi:hypothetical protein